MAIGAAAAPASVAASSAAEGEGKRESGSCSPSPPATSSQLVLTSLRPEPVGELTIQGKLEFHRLDLVLDARAIVVTGILEVEAV